MYEANYSIYACYKNSDGSSSSYLVESGYNTCLNLDKFTYDYCLNKITWSFDGNYFYPPDDIILCLTEQEYCMLKEVIRNEKTNKC